MFPGYITRDMCFLGRGTHITSDMCFPGTSLGICVSWVGEHISLVICVSLVREHISLGICVSHEGEHISLVICVSCLSSSSFGIPGGKDVGGGGGCPPSWGCGFFWNNPLRSYNLGQKC